MQFNSIQLINRTLSGATSPGKIRPASDGNKGVLCIPQTYRLTGTSPSDCLVSYPDTHWGVSYPSAEVQSLYSTASADWAIKFKVLVESLMVTLTLACQLLVSSLHTCPIH